MSKTAESELFEQIESVDDNALKDIPDSKMKPKLGDENWTEYVLSLLTDKEVVSNKNQRLPKTDGLRRIVNKVLGRIIISEAHVLDSVSEANHFTATVGHRLVIDCGDDNHITVSGVADASEGNLSPPFNMYVTANASTKALGRALRDALQLQVCVAEELNNIGDLVVVEDPEDAQSADSAQKKAIISTCKRLGIDVDRLLNMGSFRHKNLDSVLKGTARRVMSVLNGYQSGNTIPDEIKL